MTLDEKFHAAFVRDITLVIEKSGGILKKFFKNILGFRIFAFIKSRFSRFIKSIYLCN